MKLKILTALAVLITTLSSRGEIVYVNGPSFPIPGFWGSGDLDLDNDGTSDFTFWSSGMLCTQDIPTSGCGWPFYIRTTTTNEVLMSGNDVSPQSFGDRIGRDAASGDSWNTPGGLYGAGISYWWYSLQGRLIQDQLVHSGWSGGIGDVGIGYLAVRFYAPDGLHNGWVRVRMPRGGIFGPLPTLIPSPLPVAQGVTPIAFDVVPSVVDWAYETRPNTPIRAGVIGSDCDEIQFKVEFFDTNRRHRHSNRRVGTGTFILADTTLRGELALDGEFSSADIRGAMNPRMKSKSVWSFGPPLVSGTNHTAFFGETMLTRPQLIALSRGLLYVSVDDPDIVGRIVPLESEPNRRR